jgi:tetratricopeptide (TPR) repeat protein
MISHRARAAFERGQEWEERGDLTKAIHAYREAIAIEPDWAVPYQSMGTLYLQTGRFDEAATAYRQARLIPLPGDGSIDDMLYVIGMIQKNALDPAAYRYYVRARDLPDEELDEKMALCREAISLNPRYAAPYWIVGRVLLARGNPNQARAVLERGLTYDSTPFTRAALLFNLGNVLLVTGQREEALAAFRQVVELDANLEATRFATAQLEAAAAGRI